ncbi:zinc finger and BTB domain-containing protein 37 [Phycodurus eques]|uniref:zinc finger and BTB domain-containing protein 37 n=1 Tax=Phycodurus eques TaxID=693459 RepID=UPI002ACE38A9|nr:zinc finger and BTB domain-containing protein 37 [Phycodurus eques]
MERSGSIQLDVPDFSNSVLSHLNQLRVQGRLCDIVVHVQGQSFRAHKVVLAASSPYFRDHMSLSQMSTVSLTVIRNASVFEQLLGFCYTGRLRLQLRDIISYLTAASFLQMQEVIDRCTRILEGIHLKISLADPDREAAPRPRGLEAPVGPARRAEASGRGEEPRGPEPAPREPVLRVDRAGRWYVENSGEADEGADGVAVKTEREERRIGADADRNESGPADEGVAGDASGSYGGARPSGGHGDADRWSPSGSVVVLADHQRAKSESPSRSEDLRHANSQGEEAAAAAYEDYARDPVGERWFRYNPRLTCIYCCKSFNQKGSLDRHMRLHMGITPFVCRLCGKKYTRKDQLEYHIRKHTGNKPFTCRLCAKSFPFQAILNQHLRKNHPGHHAQSASPETTTASLSARGASPGQDDPEGAGAAYGEGPHASVSTTGPD